MESLQCLNCKHYDGGFDTGMHCEAYPVEAGKAIPYQIFSGEFNHTKKYDGDNGIRYESSGNLPWVDEEYDDILDDEDEKEFKKER